MSTHTIIYSRASQGIHAPLVEIEAHLSPGLPRFTIVGLPETAVKESKDRVRSALLSSNFRFPPGRITVNLAPADLPKDGGRFDLPIALGILVASRQIPVQQLDQFEFAGELALSGALRPIQGALPFALATRAGNRALLLPEENAAEASLASNLVLIPARHLLEVCAHFTGQQRLPEYQRQANRSVKSFNLDLADIRGQAQGKRALEIAAAGQHSLLMSGPPGTGKTMLASRLATILPDMLENEALEAAAVLSIAGKPVDESNFRIRPFRSPHHTASSVALVGGGSPPKPGEISLAHHGVLFLDELPEFNRNVLEALREPLESNHVTISRASYSAQFPAQFQLIAAMNPCPCGQQGNSASHCQCTPEQIQRYQTRISGPLLDRIDLFIQIGSPGKGLLCATNAEESSSIIKARVVKAREIQLSRNDNRPNAALMSKDIEEICSLSNDDRIFLAEALERLGLSARAYHRVLKVARTIADLAGSTSIDTLHLKEALSYRRLQFKGN